jgi:hypothetical protein
VGNLWSKVEMSKPQSLIDMENQFAEAMADAGITSEADVYTVGDDNLEALYEQLVIKRSDFAKGQVIRGGRRRSGRDRRTQRRKSIRRKSRHMRHRK